jgi:hypothetical protein
MSRFFHKPTRSVYPIVAKLLITSAFCMYTVLLQGNEADEIISHHIDSPFQKDRTTLRVLVPDNYSEKTNYKVLYVLPVREQGNRKNGDGLMEVYKNNFHNKYSLICVAPGYTHLPWYADHSKDLTRQDESHFLKTVIPFIDENYSTQKHKEGRILLGFSKSGWGAITLLLRNPEIFHKAAGWDIGIRMDTELLKEEENEEWIEDIEHIFGNMKNFEHYRVSALLKRKAKELGDEARIFYYNREGNRGSGGAMIHSLMLELGIPHLYWYEPFRKHRWDSGWMPDAVHFLAGDGTP